MSEINLEQQLNKQREKLLDLSLRNPLLNFRERNAKILRIIDELPNQVYKMIVDDGISMSLLPLEKNEPEKKDIEPDEEKEKERSLSQVFSTDEVDLEEKRADEEDIVDELPDTDASEEYLFDDKLQTDLDNDKYEGRLRRIYNEYQLQIEATGSNSLFMAMGFIEWHDTGNDPEKPRYAPLILVPIEIRREIEQIEIESDDGNPDVLRVYRYHAKHSGEDIKENLTLKLKLKRSPFNFTLPDFLADEQSSPEVYFDQLKRMFSRWRTPTGHEWKLKRQIRIGFFSFNKSVMYEDLNPEKWNSTKLVDLPGIRLVLEGREKGEKNEILDVDVELSHKEQTLPTVMDADSSQMKTLLRMHGGDDIVVQGPPGTGKSQTITNMIALALSEGKKVLFMAEKLAALQVVRTRLEHVSLGPFCLELHSNHATTKDILQQIKRRLDHKADMPKYDIHRVLEPLNSAREKLHEHCEMMGRIIPELECTWFDLLWRQRAHQESFYEKTGIEHTVSIPNANENRLPDPKDLSELSDQMETIRRNWKDNIHKRGKVWNGFQVRRINQNQLTQIEHILDQSTHILDEWYEYQKTVQHAGDLHTYTPDKLKFLYEALDVKPPENIMPVVLHSIAHDIHEVEKYRIYLDDIQFIKTHYESHAFRLSQKKELSDTILLLIQENVKELMRLSESIGNNIKETQIQIEDYKDCCKAIKQQDNLVEDIKNILNLQQPYNTMEDQDRLVKQMEYLLSLDSKTLGSIDIAHLKANVNKYRDNAIENFNDLQERENKLSKWYLIEDAPDDNEIRELRKGLREVSQSWLKWLPFGRCAKVKRIARRFARIGVNIFGREFIENLSELSSYRQDSLIFCNDESFKFNLGRIFQGLDTDWNLLKDCILTVQEIHSWFVGEENVHDFIEQLSDFESTRESIRKNVTLIHNLKKEMNDYPSFGFVGDINRLSIQDLLTKLNNFCEEIIVKLKNLDQMLLEPHIPYDEMIQTNELVQKLRIAMERVNLFTTDPTFLGEFYKGIHDTDCQAIAENVKWARDLKNQSVIHHSLSTWILEENQLDRFAFVLEAVQKLFQFLERFLSTIKALTDFGKVDESIFSSTHGNWLPGQRLSDLKNARLETDILMRWSDYIHSRQWLNDNGYGQLFSFAEDQNISGEHLRLLSEAAFYKQWLDETTKRFPDFLNFTRIEYELKRDIFKREDKKLFDYHQSSIAYKLLANNSPSGTRGKGVKNYTEMVLINHQLKLQRRHCTVRHLIESAPQSLLSLMPCWMMGPVSIANFIPPELVQFDLLIIDEASQIKPEDALGALARAKQIVVVGDSNQMPPSDFFSSTKINDDEEDGELNPIQDLRSILDVCSSFFISERLLWHYRSQHETLILFSNEQYYDSELIIPPSIYKGHPNYGIQWHYCEDATFHDGKNELEAQQVVDLLVRHIIENSRKTPDKMETIGIVAMNNKQSSLIDEMLEKERLKSSSLENAISDFNRNVHNEPYFIRNLENVQGDERDVIVISFTYGPSTDTRRVYQRFGPIAREGGWRRLNVLFTRARRRIHVFSSMKESDIVIPNEGHRRGAADMKKYLAFAEKGKLHDYGVQDIRGPESPFEESVNRVITKLGFGGHFQVGVDGFRVDVGVVNPNDPSTYMCGIECDGAPYHSHPIARDRDRLREEILEQRGWKIFRIWSTDWYRNRKTEEERLEEYLHSLL